ncbi:hypothetical protein Tco_1159386 [Tanacetum coccineum]
MEKSIPIKPALKSALKSTKSDVPTLVTSLRNIEGRPLMAKRGVTLTKPLNDVEKHSKQNTPDAKEVFGMNSSLSVDEVVTTVQEGGSKEGQIVSPDAAEHKEVVPPKSFVDVIASNNVSTKLNFRTLHSSTRVEEADCVLPVEHVMAAQNKFANSLVIRDDDDVFYFKFTSITGMEQVLEQGPWMIRNQPLILTKWTPNLTLSKDKVTKVPIWVKIHKVPVVAYSVDGLSLIGTQIGKPILLDAFTSSMCKDMWGRIGYARALIEVSADKELKNEVTMAIPNLNGEGHTKETMKCPKIVLEPVVESNEANDEGFTTVKNRKRKGKKVENVRQDK